MTSSSWAGSMALRWFQFFTAPDFRGDLAEEKVRSDYQGRKASDVGGGNEDGRGFFP